MNDARRTRRTRAAGVVLAGVIAGVFTLTGAFYTHAFADDLQITVNASRSGLIMDPGAKVKYRGIEVGRVEAVVKTEGGARLELAVDPGRAERIPAAVGAQIQATTIFGAKYVELVDRHRSRGGTLEAGAVIEARGVTTEVNTLFERLDGVLSAVDVVGLNQTLGELSTALGGRGSSIAELAADADRYLTALEPSLPTLRRDLRQVAKLSDLGVRLEPALVALLDSAATPLRTIASEEQRLDRVLVNLALLSVSAEDLVDINGDALLSNLRALRPTTQLLFDFAGELPCFLRGLERSGELAGAGAGGTSPGLNILASLRTQVRPYSPATDMPTPARGAGARCGTLPYLGTADLPAPERTDR